MTKLTDANTLEEGRFIYVSESSGHVWCFMDSGAVVGHNIRAMRAYATGLLHLMVERWEKGTRAQG